MEKTRLTTKGQLVIPKAIRDRMRVAAGTEFKVTQSGERIVLETVRRKQHALRDWPGFKQPLQPLADSVAFSPVKLADDDCN